MTRSPTPVSAPPKLASSFAWTFAGNASFAVAQWLIVVVLARLGSAEIVGTYTLGLALCAPVFMLFNLQLRAVQATDTVRDYSFADYAGLRTLCVVVAGATIALIVSVGDYRSATGAILLVGLAKAVESCSDLAYGELQRTERMKQIGESLVLRGLVTAAVVTGVVAGTESLVLALSALVAVWGAVAAFHDLPAAARTARVTASFDRPRLRKMFLLSLPLGVVMMLISLTYNVPRYFIEHELGTRSLGYFAAVSYLAVAGTTVVNSMGEAVSPRLARLYAIGDVSAFTRLLRRFVAIAAALGAASVTLSAAAGRWVLEFLYGPPYGDYADVFLVTMVGAAVSYVASCIGFGITATRTFRIQPFLFAAVTAASALSCAVLVPRYGLAGAAWGFAAGSITHLLGSLVIAGSLIHTRRGSTSDTRS